MKTFIKEMKNAPKCIVELYKHTDTIKNMTEVHRKAQPQPSASRTSRVFLKIPKCIYNSTMYEGKLFISFTKY